MLLLFLPLKYVPLKENNYEITLRPYSIEREISMSHFLMVTLHIHLVKNQGLLWVPLIEG